MKAISMKDPAHRTMPALLEPDHLYGRSLMRLFSLSSLLVPLVAGTLTGCAAHRAAAPTSSPAVQAPAASAAQEGSSPATAATAAAHGEALPFVTDDYQAALNTARARKVPIFVEAWAPW
jgi:hypothetical protein